MSDSHSAVLITSHYYPVKAKKYMDESINNSTFYTIGCANSIQWICIQWEIEGETSKNKIDLNAGIKYTTLHNRIIVHF